MLDTAQSPTTSPAEYAPGGISLPTSLYMVDRNLPWAEQDALVLQREIDAIQTPDGDYYLRNRYRTRLECGYDAGHLRRTGQRTEIMYLVDAGEARCWVHVHPMADVDPRDEVGGGFRRLMIRGQRIVGDEIINLRDPIAP